MPPRPAWARSDSSTPSSLGPTNPNPPVELVATRLANSRHNHRLLTTSWPYLGNAQLLFCPFTPSQQRYSNGALDRRNETSPVSTTFNFSNGPKLTPQPPALWAPLSKKNGVQPIPIFLKVQNRALPRTPRRRTRIHRRYLSGLWLGRSFLICEGLPSRYWNKSELFSKKIPMTTNPENSFT